MKFLRRRKWEIMLLVFFFSVLVFTHLNTFIVSDDLPYSFYLRQTKRITSILEIIKNQWVDYRYISSRVIIHSIVQFLLIYGKKVWAILNPLMIISNIAFILKIVLLKGNQKHNSKSLLLCIVMFLYLLLYTFKPIIYWVAGSVNYVWPSTLLIVLLYLYYKYGFCKYKIINIFIIGFLCMLCESTMVFTVCFVTFQFFLDWYQNKKINKDYMWYFIGFVGCFIILFSPSTFIRMSSDKVWNHLGIIDKLKLSIPIVSHNLLDFKNLLNILPYFFGISIIINIYNTKMAKRYLLIALIVLNYLLIMFIDNNWLYVILIIILFICECSIYIKSKNLSLLVMSLSFYAVVFFNVFTPLYMYGRPNYYFYCYVIFYTVYTLNMFKLNRTIIYIIVSILLGIVLANDVIIYGNIGKNHRKNLKLIHHCHEIQCKTLVLRKYPDYYSYYHMDLYMPTKDYFTYDSFINYYKLPKNIDIIYK